MNRKKNSTLNNLIKKSLYLRSNFIIHKNQLIMKKLFTFLAILFAVFALNAQTFLDEGFESGLPATWTTLDNDGDTYIWYELVNAGDPVITGHTGVGLMTSASWSTVALTPDNWLITPQINLTSASYISYWVCGQDPDWAGEHYGVYISTTGTSVSDFSLLFQETLPTPETARTWYNRHININSYSGNVYIAFRHFNCSDMFRINLDDILVSAGTDITENENVNVSIYPNPANNVLNVTANGYNKMEIINFLGQVVINENVSNTNFEVNVSNLNSGVYFVRLQGENGTITKKFVKK